MKCFICWDLGVISFFMVEGSVNINMEIYKVKRYLIKRSRFKYFF